MSTVASDNIAGGRKIADFLLQAGYRKIGYIAGWEDASTQRDRQLGFETRLEEDGISLHVRGLGNFNMTDAAQATREMFASDPPDAVFVCNDHMAFSVMDTLRFELNLRVPEDVAVVGYDDVPTSAWPAYNLTTVRQPANRMVSETVDILLEKIADRDAQPRHVQIDGPLIVRGSTRLPEGWKK
jgi:DNA-binding LacI/PurR family transcriptional regulator